MVKTSSLAAMAGGRIGLEILQSPILRELSLFYLSGVSHEDTTCKACLYLIRLRVHPVQSDFSAGAFVKNNQWKLFNSMAA